jgi:hypothetical protein
MTDYSFFTDWNGNEYRWSKKKESDGKFHAIIIKRGVTSSYGGYGGKWKVVKKREFNLRRKAKAYCLTACRKAIEHQKIVSQRRSEKKQQRQQEKLAKQPKGKEKTKLEYAKKIAHVKELIKNIDGKIKKADSKTKALISRKKTYLKKLKYFDKAHSKIRQQMYDEIEA